MHIHEQKQIQKRNQSTQTTQTISHKWANIFWVALQQSTTNFIAKPPSRKESERDTPM